MSPVKVKHSFYQGRLITVLESFLQVGEIMPECAVQTSEGVKVADVVWCSPDRFKIIENDIAASIAPEICVEVKSDSNTVEEMEMKKSLYLEVGAVEVWFCDQNGQLEFYHQDGKLDHSLLVPEFPQQIQKQR